MILLLILLYLALTVGIVAFDAWILTIHVPTIVADPTNFGAWFWIILTLSLTIFGGSRAGKD